MEMGVGVELAAGKEPTRRTAAVAAASAIAAAAA